MKHFNLAILVFAGVAFVAADATLAGAQAPATAPAPAAGTAPRPKFVAPVRGEAEVGYLKPNTKVVGDQVVAVIKM